MFGANTFSTEFSTNVPHSTDIYVHKVNYRVLKGAACDYAQNRVACGWLTLRAGYPVA